MKLEAVHTRQEDGSGESREWSIRSLEAFAKTVKPSEKGLAEALAFPVSELERMELEALVEEIRHLNGSIAKVEALLRDQGPKLPGWENLISNWIFEDFPRFVLANG